MAPWTTVGGTSLVASVSVSTSFPGYGQWTCLSPDQPAYVYVCGPMDKDDGA